MRSRLWRDGLSLSATAALAVLGLAPAITPAAAAGTAEQTYIVVTDTGNVDVAGMEARGHHVVGGAREAGFLIVRSSDPAGLALTGGVSAVAADRARYTAPGGAEAEAAGPEADPSALPAAPCASTTQSCGLQWDLDRIGVPSAWTVTRGDPQLSVAVLDTGMNSKHVNVPARYDVAGSRSEVRPNAVCAKDAATFASLEDFHGHGTWTGTHVAGRGNSLMTGIAPGVTYLNYRVLGACGFGYDSWVMQGMLDASLHGARIESMSLGGFLCAGGIVPGSFYCGTAQDVGQDPAVFHAYRKLVQFLDSRGTLVIAAAGNDSLQVDHHGAVSSHGTLADCKLAVDPCNDYFGLTEAPGGIPGVVGVAALNRVTAPSSTKYGQYGVGERDQLTYYSNWGPKVDVSAPGGARNGNVPRFDCLNSACARLGVSAPGKTDNPGDFGAWGTCGPTCYMYVQGTSMATPQVAGAAALALSARPHLSAGSLRQVLLQSVTPFASASATPGIEDNSASPLFGWDKDYDGAAIGNSLMGSGVISAAMAAGA